MDEARKRGAFRFFRIKTGVHRGVYRAVFPDEYYEEEKTALECCVCQESLSSKPSETLLCFHTFHTACLISWRERATTCPICRSDMDTGEQANVDEKEEEKEGLDLDVSTLSLYDEDEEDLVVVTTPPPRRVVSDSFIQTLAGEVEEKVEEAEVKEKPFAELKDTGSDTELCFVGVGKVKCQPAMDLVLRLVTALNLDGKHQEADCVQELARHYCTSGVNELWVKATDITALRVPDSKSKRAIKAGSRLVSLLRDSDYRLGTTKMDMDQFLNW